MKDLKDCDIVYFVKESEENEELKYSLRTVELNFPHRNVWFIGGCPKGIKPDKHLKVVQDKETKWENTNELMRAACECKNISDDFILFNDDFFVLNPITELPYYYDGTLSERIYSLSGHSHSEYKQKLVGCRNMLLARNYTELNYAVHVPIRINKVYQLKCMERFPQGLMWRSLYGNYINPQNPVPIKDPKIADSYSGVEDSDYVSTNDYSFEYGFIGRLIKNNFPNPSRFEKS